MHLQPDTKRFLRTNVSLAPYSTLKVGGPASYFAEPKSRDELASVAHFVQQEGLLCFVLGRGSNTLFDDQGFHGCVIHTRKLEPDLFLSENKSLIKVSAGMGLFRLSWLCQSKGFGGIEFLCHVPGTVGGAIAMNAGFARPGCAWREMKNVVKSVTIMDLSGVTQKLNCDELGFSYRESHLKPGQIVLDVELELELNDPEIIKQEITENFKYRNSVQDLSLPSLGSTFKNPTQSKQTSGQLLDLVGMRGMRRGGAMVSNRHANFIMNVDQAKARDVLDLMQIAQTRVFEKFGIKLMPEIKHIFPLGQESIEK